MNQNKERNFEVCFFYFELMLCKVLNSLSSLTFSFFNTAYSSSKAQLRWSIANRSAAVVVNFSSSRSWYIFVLISSILFSISICRFPFILICSACALPHLKMIRIREVQKELGYRNLPTISKEMQQRISELVSPLPQVFARFKVSIYQLVRKRLIRV